ncbi:MAG: hypothetical protein GF399_00965 [Candidatus Coatesbacteria bacterium]|nr:hypothetical protein [Candidatus Coatesbacteria bacterium]
MTFRQTSILSAGLILLAAFSVGAELAPNEKAAWLYSRTAFELTADYGIVEERTPEELTELAESAEELAVDFIIDLRRWFEDLGAGVIVDESAADYRAIDHLLGYLLEKVELLLDELERENHDACANLLGSLHRLTPSLAEGFGNHDY